MNNLGTKQRIHRILKGHQVTRNVLRLIGELVVR
jgi:hypothetical protein